MTKETQNKYIYYLEDSIYINVTNLCTNECEFCVKTSGECVGGVNLVFEKEDFTHKEIIAELKENFSEKCKEIIFCGYGEPLLKLDIIKNTAKFIKENYPNTPVRINTNGHANLIHKRNIVPELVGLIDKISVSLNAENATLYEEICKPKFEKEIVYNNIQKFISECVKNGIDTTATVVTGYKNYNVNVESCRKITEDLGAKFRVREWLPDGYN